jgi:hypothetical protein
LREWLGASAALLSRRFGGAGFRCFPMRAPAEEMAGWLGDGGGEVGRMDECMDGWFRRGVCREGEVGVEL